MEQSRNFSRRNGQKRVVAHRNPLSVAKLDYMLCTLMRRLDAFLEASTQLTPAHFTDGELAKKAIWAALTEYYQRYNELPTYLQLKNEVRDRAADDPDFTQDDKRAAADLLRVAFGNDIEVWQTKQALDFVRMFLEERLVDTVRQDLELTARVPTDFYSVATLYAERASAIRALGANFSTVPFPDGWSLQAKPMDIIPTNVPFIDSYLDGGHVPGQVQLYLGCYGGGKSMLAIQLSIASASSFWNLWVTGGQKGPLPLVYLVSYEDSLDEIRLRALAHQANIPFERLTRAQKSKTALSTSDSLQDYEKARWATALRNGEQVRGERERLQDAMALMNRNWRVLDMSGQDSEQQGVGTGLHAELLGAIHRDLRDTTKNAGEVCCGAVVLDYVGAAVKKHIDHQAIDRALMRHYINEFPLHFKQRVLQPLKACGHLFHQYDTKHQAMQPGRSGDHNAASEGKAIGESANFCFNLGKPTNEGLLVWSTSKCRRTGRDQPPRILKLDGQYSTIRDTSDQYVLDARTARIVSRDEARSVAGGEIVGAASSSFSQSIYEGFEAESGSFDDD